MKRQLKLNVWLLKSSVDSTEANILSDPDKVRSYELNPELDLKGKLFVKKPEIRQPDWFQTVQQLSRAQIEEIENSSGSAVLQIEASGRTFIFTFGYGRFLLEMGNFVQDFGVKTALNTLDHNSLRSVDLLSLEDQALLKSAQSARDSQINAFGVDAHRDVLKGITGSPIKGLDFSYIHGGGPVYSLSTKIEVAEMKEYARIIYRHYQKDTYKKEFGWVDNVKRILDRKSIEKLDAELIKSIKAKDDTVLSLTCPEIIKWSEVEGFSFTRSKNQIRPMLSSLDYFESISSGSDLTVEKVKNDKIFVHGTNGENEAISAYKCMYLECKKNDSVFVLFDGVWYEIDKSFKKSVQEYITTLPICKIAFPKVLSWNEITEGKEKRKIESEGDWNDRAAKSLGCALMDKKLVKYDQSTSSIELCDLLTIENKFIHVKHRKGGSSGLSHLFFQGSVSAEAMLGDKQFRKKARIKIRRVDPKFQECVELNGFKSQGKEICFVILGASEREPWNSLPFFSQISLWKTAQNLLQRGYRVSIGGVEISHQAS